MEQAIQELGSEVGARIAEPGKFVVWRDETGVRVELKSCKTASSEKITL